jgi:hypothetical protein
MSCPKWCPELQIICYVRVTWWQSHILCPRGRRLQWNKVNCNLAVIAPDDIYTIQNMLHILHSIPGLSMHLSIETQICHYFTGRIHKKGLFKLMPRAWVGPKLFKICLPKSLATDSPSGKRWKKPPIVRPVYILRKTLYGISKFLASCQLAKFPASKQ